jgi:hypothetical protein
VHKVISKILNTNGFFSGGFVRDFLIRGEKFSDIDYSFYNSYSINSLNKTVNILGKGQVDLSSLEQKDWLDGLLFHYYQRPYYYDLSCNFFGFDKDGFFPLPSFHTFDLNKAWELILNKKFYKLCDGKLTTIKMLNLGWEMEGEIYDKEDQIIKHPKNGIWDNYNEMATKRLNELIY